MAKKAWAGRFDQDLNRDALAFSASVNVDKRLAEHDIQGSLAHVAMLAAQQIITKAEHKQLHDGLLLVLDDIQQNRFVWRDEHEDVHLNIEKALSEKIGAVAGKLHTARSRNDQVATDVRLWTKQALGDTQVKIKTLIETILVQAEQHLDTVMPGYTHLQRAQPVRLSHHLLAWAEMFERDGSRFNDALARMNQCPLGAGALATTTFALDRHASAKTLGFTEPTRNSMDSVADRDFIFEALAALANCAIHLSRVAEELVIWNTQEFGFVTMSDTYATGSSMMPQKKNPDMAELIRGKCGRVVGDLVNVAVLLKGLPLTYNRDLQEDKAPLFDAFDTVQASLNIMSGMLGTLTFSPLRMRQALQQGFLDATEVADYLAAKGVPFRDAHHVSGALVAYASKQNKTLAELTLDELRQHHASFDADLYPMLEPEQMIERRNVYGGPAKAQVQAQIAAFRNRLT